MGIGINDAMEKRTKDVSKGLLGGYILYVL
jgi:hypothetical protein